MDLESLVVNIVGDASQYERVLGSVVAQTGAATAKVEALTSQIGGTLSSIGGQFTQVKEALLGVAGVSGVFDALQKSFSLAAFREESEIMFGSMLMNIEKGKTAVKDIIQLASRTPLVTTDLLAASRTLLQFDAAGNDLIGTLTMLGDVTGGNADRLRAMSLAYGQSSAAGRLMGQDLLQMINAGFNPLQEISKNTGRSMKELKDQMQKGGVSTAMVRDAFRSAAGEGGRFYKNMEKMSRSLNGLVSTLKDNVQIALMDVGAALVESLDVKRIVEQTAKGAGAIGKFIGNIPREIRQAAVAIPALTVGLSLFIGLLVAGAAAVTMLFTPFGVIMALLVGLSTATVTWVQRVGGLAPAWEKASAYAKEFFGKALGWGERFIQNNAKAILAVAGVAAVLAVLALAFKSVSIAGAILQAIMVLTGINLVINTALWIAGKVAIIAFTVVTVILKIAFWLLNLAITATNASLGIFLGILAAAAFAVAVAVVIALAAAIVAVGAAIYAAYKAGDMLLDTLMALPSTSGPVRVIRDLFGEWWSILKEVVATAKSDLPAAFALLKAGFRLAIEQVKQYFPPLWIYMQVGFEQIWGVVAKKFSLEFDRAIGEAMIQVYEVLSALESAMTNRSAEAEALETIKIFKMRKEAAEAYAEAAADLGREVGAVVKGMGKLGKNLFDNIGDNEAVKNAKEALWEMRWQIAEMDIPEIVVPVVPEADPDAVDGAKKLGKAVGKSYSDAALTGSAEALSRVMAFQMQDKGQGLGGWTRTGAFNEDAMATRRQMDARNRSPIGVAPINAGLGPMIDINVQKDPSVPVLKDIRGLMQQQIRIASANKENAGIADA